MADISLVIKIPEELKDKIDNANEDNYRTYIGWFETTLYCAIKNGTPLPKGHGDLKIVINISHSLYDRLIDMNIDSDTCSFNESALVESIQNGMLLPKGYGRLGDLDFLAKRIKSKPPIGEIGKVVLEECYQEVLSAKTIIEADTERGRTTNEHYSRASANVCGWMAKGASGC